MNTRGNKEDEEIKRTELKEEMISKEGKEEVKKMKER